MDTIDRWDAVERNRLASTGAVALNWRRIAHLLPIRYGVTVDDVIVRGPLGSTDLNHSVTFFKLLDDRQVSSADLWAAMTEAGLQAFIPSSEWLVGPYLCLFEDCGLCVCACSALWCDQLSL
eukprot:TRINITY_DN5481_c0_g1_i1.p1 TRINITY_DN5481_c0_g1~~TRINITY_DN5481_c0_g1_i1.p1  ORF type:complete len:122 (-),score=8.92 TRINITY_DN5481_c0_g1_i1:39-404(-)